MYVLRFATLQYITGDLVQNPANLDAKECIYPGPQYNTDDNRQA